MTDKIALLRQGFDLIGLPQDAADWLVMVWDFIQLVDDCYDGDTPSAEGADRVAWSMLVGMPSNPFYRANMDSLTPILALQVLKWRVSNFREKNGMADAKTYMWRAGYYDLVLAAAQLCGVGQEINAIPDLYGENLSDYLQEMMGGKDA